MTSLKIRVLWFSLSGWQKALLVKFWPILASSSQQAPEGEWDIWLILGGRGAGKTRAGAEWIRAQVKAGARDIALVGPNFTEAREVMLEGKSGLLNIGHPAERPKYIASRRRLEWPNGAVGHLYSAEDPDGLRGAQFDVAWADEFCAWSYPEDTLANLRLALRLGDAPKLTLTTTPRPIQALLDLKAEAGVISHHMRTAENAHNLSPSFLETVTTRFGGTPLGQQELEGEILQELPGALWSLSGIAAQRVTSTPDLARIVIAVDPPTTSGPKADACGIIVAGQAHGQAYVLEDATQRQATPDIWAAKVVDLFHRYRADCVIAEDNQGGEMVEAVLRQIDPQLPIIRVHATRGKYRRAEPVAHLYTQGKVFHAGRFKALETQMCQMGAKNMKGSPDRVDALVWAVNALLMRGRPEPRVRWA